MEPRVSVLRDSYHFWGQGHTAFPTLPSTGDGTTKRQCPRGF